MSDNRSEQPLPLVMYPESEHLLHQKSHEVTIFNHSLKQLCQQMINTMYQAEGIGLAAIQVGIQQRIFVMQVPDQQAQVFINPTIIDYNEEKIEAEEGCLSIPETHAKILRYQQILVEAKCPDGNLFQQSFSDLLAICVQHEIDHLNGILFIDYLSTFKRNRIRNKLLKLAHQNK